MSLVKNGVYIHVPFCRSKCDYCGFYSLPVAPGSEIINSYVQALVREVKSLPYDLFEAEADSLYFGGGTPSMLSAGQLSSVISSLSDRFSFADGAEITVEMNPEDFSPEKISGYLELGVNRIVLGVQSLDEESRRIIGRRGNYSIKEKLEQFFSEKGFIRCVDVITGIPGKNGAGTLDDLKVITGFRPEHISLYLLSVEEGTPLASRIVPDNSFEEMQARVWGECIDFLDASGYSHYEVSNFSLPGFESVHNSKYWHFIPYAGFGPGAHSFTGDKRYCNSMTVDEYIIADNFKYTFDERTDSDVIVEFFMTALRDLRGFSAGDFKRVTGRGISAELLSILDSLVRKGDVRYNDSRYSLTRSGLFRANRVVYEITEGYIGGSPNH